MLDRKLEDAVRALAARFALADGAADRMLRLVACVAEDPHAPTGVSDPAGIVDRHLADSLSALELAALRPDAQAVDIGSGAGFPGLPLAVARPQSDWVLLEGNRRKCEFIGRAAAAAGVDNARAVNERAELWEDGLGRFDLATARALAGLDVVIEYAAPLLAVGGRLIAWRGRRDPEAERAAERAAALTGMEIGEVRATKPFPAAETRHLHVISKVVETPPGFPRRAGMAAKSPLGGRS